MITKKIALFGTNEPLVKHIALEGLKRGHQITAVIPNPDELNFKHSHFRVFSGDLMNRSDITRYAKGNDVVISLHEPVIHQHKKHIEANRAIIEGAKDADIRRIISLGHPVSLKSMEGKAFYDLQETLEKAQHETLNLYKNEFWLRWVYMHSVDLSHIHKTSAYATDDEIFVSDPEGTHKVVNINQLTDALLEEAEKTEYIPAEDEIII